MTIQLADGTVVDQTAFLATHSTAATPPNVFTINSDLYETGFLPGAQLTHTTRRLKFRAGEVITQAQVDALYLEPTVPGALVPATGAAAGGTSVVLTGTNLYETTGVTFDGTAGTITAKTDTTVTVTTPAHAAGAVAVVLTTPAGSVTKAGAFTYT